MKWTLIMSILLGLIWGCGGRAVVEQSEPGEDFCPAGSKEVLEERVGQLHQWCRDAAGRAHGPFQVSYESGRKKLGFSTVHGVVHGDYQGWHTSGRWAIQTAYEQGKPTGRLKIRPPFGPHTECLAARCGYRANFLDRPHCLPEEIDAVFAERTDDLQACFEVIDRPTRTHVELSWQVKLMGQPAAIGLRLEPDVPDIVVSCIEELLMKQRFPAPLGGECDVSLAFEFEPKGPGTPARGASAK